MTIAVAVRTRSAVVFATDSKVTATSLNGIAEDGSLLWVDQVYDNATKVVHDRRKRLMALVIGHANVGPTNADDFIASYSFPDCETEEQEDREVITLLDMMNEHRRIFWSETAIPPENWLGPTLLVALASRNKPRVWSISMEKADYELHEVLERPQLWLGGAFNDVFTLLYGIRPAVVDALAHTLGLSRADMTDALRTMRIMRPMDRINFATMPLQDAIDLAVFLADLQIQMDRFLPGQAACGGPIDVMALRTSPTGEILSYPGKSLHHPQDRGRLGQARST